MDTKTLLETVIYPRLSHEVVFDDLNLRRQGKAYIGTCPACGKRDHFYALEHWQFGKCHKGSCIYHGKGNLLSWWQHTANRYGLRHSKDILSKLAELAGINLAQYTDRNYKAVSTVADVHRIFGEIGRRAARKMPSVFLRYLQGRGFTPDNIRQSGILYMERESSLRALQAAGCSIDLIKQAGLLTTGYGEQYHILLPHVYESVCGYIARLDPGVSGLPKYKNSIGSSRDIPFGFSTASKPDVWKLIVVEGPLDALLINLQLGEQGVAAVALCGDSLSDAGLTLINRSAARFVVLALDNDTAGRRGTSALLGGLRKRVMVVPAYDGYKDPGELIAARGIQRFRQVLESAMPAVTWAFTEICTAAAGRLRWNIDLIRRIAPIYHAQQTDEDRRLFLEQAKATTLLHERDILAAVDATD